MAKFDISAVRARTMRAVAPYKQQVQRLQIAQRAMVARTSGKGGDLKSAGLVVAGGAGGGALAGYMPQIGGIDSRWIVGGALAAAGAFAIKGKMGGAMMLLGAGILANAAGNATQAMIAPDGV